MFLETICIKNGVAVSLEDHAERMRQTADRFGFTAPGLPCIESLLPGSLRDKKVKCSIGYRETIRTVGFVAVQVFRQGAAGGAEQPGRKGR